MTLHLRRLMARAPWPVAALLLVAVGWLATPHPVPLYDGIGFPDEPYRYIAPPAGSKPTKPAGVARARITTVKGHNAYLDAASDEFGPQVVVHLPEGVMSVPRAAGTVTVQAEPLAPHDGAPADGTLTGNIYRVTVACDSGAVAFARNGAGDLTLREPVLTTTLPQMVHRADARHEWRWLKTQRVGQDYFRAPLRQPGEYALAVPAHGGIAADSSPETDQAATETGGAVARGTVLILGGVVLLMALIVVVIRVRVRARPRGGSE